MYYVNNGGQARNQLGKLRGAEKFSDKGHIF